MGKKSVADLLNGHSGDAGTLLPDGRLNGGGGLQEHTLAGIGGVINVGQVLAGDLGAQLLGREGLSPHFQYAEKSNQ